MTTFAVVVVVVNNIEVYLIPSQAYQVSKHRRERYLTHNFHSSLPDANARVCTVSTNDSQPGVNYYFGDVGGLF